MEQLRKSIERFEHDGDKGILDDAAAKWAAFCLVNYRGKRLRRGIEISIAMSEFAGRYPSELELADSARPAGER